MDQRMLRGSRWEAKGVDFAELSSSVANWIVFLKKIV